MSERRRQVRTKARVRAIIAISLIVVWSIVTFSGFLIYVAPQGRRSGWATILLLTKSQWRDIHFWVGIVALLITVIHIVVDWRALRGCIRYLCSVERPSGPGEASDSP